MLKIAEINNKIKNLREFSDYSAAEFAALLALTEEEYIEYETGKKPLTINLLYEIASVLDIELGVLTGEKDYATKKPVFIESGKSIEIERYAGYSFHSLNTGYSDAKIEPMLVTVKCGRVPELVKHKGEEFNFVLNGNLRVLVGEKEFYLKEGDSIYFNAREPHAQIAMTPVAEFLTVIQK